MAPAVSIDNVEVRPCTRDDIDGIQRSDVRWADLAHHRERFAMQQRAAATYLLAWHHGEVVGRVTLFYRSKFESVRAAYGGLWELNALEATPQGQGIGSLLIGRAHRIAVGHGVALTGLAVEPDNTGACRLYRRLGYHDWGRGTVLDEWVEPNEAGETVREHRDTCQYLIRSAAERPRKHT